MNNPFNILYARIDKMLHEEDRVIELRTILTLLQIYDMHVMSDDQLLNLARNSTTFKVSSFHHRPDGYQI